MITLIIVAAIFVIMGVVILIGKGDNLIAGYNTASKEERAKYHIKRLRGLIGGLLIVLAPMLFLLHGETMAATGSSAAKATRERPTTKIINFLSIQIYSFFKI